MTIGRKARCHPARSLRARNLHDRLGISRLWLEMTGVGLVDEYRSLSRASYSCTKPPTVISTEGRNPEASMLQSRAACNAYDPRSSACGDGRVATRPYEVKYDYVKTRAHANRAAAPSQIFVGAAREPPFSRTACPFTPHAATLRSGFLARAAHFTAEPPDSRSARYELKALL
jgi:hypothetical protein